VRAVFTHVSPCVLLYDETFVRKRGHFNAYEGIGPPFTVNGTVMSAN